MEPDQVWVELLCYQDHAPEAAAALREAFAAAGIPGQLLDVVFTEPGGLPGRAGARVADGMHNPLLEQLTGVLMAKVARTDAAAAVLRRGAEDKSGLNWGSWLFSRNITRARELAGAPRAADAPYQIQDWVRVLTWPFEGLTGRVGAINKSKSKMTVVVQALGNLNILTLDPTELEPAAETPARAWYVLYGAAGKERQLADALLKRIREAGLLHRLFGLACAGQGPQTIRLVKDGQAQNVTPAQIPGAVFALLSLDEATWQVIRQTPGLTGFVGQGEQPVGYPPAESA